MSIPQFVDGETDLDSITFNRIVNRVNAITDGTAPIALAGIEAALEGYGPLIYSKSERVNVREYVTPNGSTDNTAGIQAAATAALGKWLYFPRGDYVMRSASSYGNGLWISTAGTLNEVAPGAVIPPASDSAIGYCFINILAAGVRVYGGHLDGNGLDDCFGVHVRNGASRVTIEGMTFQEIETPAFSSGATNRITIRDNDFIMSKWGVLTKDDATPKRWRISGNNFDGAEMTGGGDAVEINTPDGLSEDFVITGNSVENITRTTSSNGIGIGIAHGVRAVIADNLVRNCGLDGIHVEDDATDTVVSGNIISGCDRTGIAINGANGAAPLDGVVVAHNTVRECGQLYGTGGIALEGNVAVHNAVVDGNLVMDCGRADADEYYGIDLQFGAVGHRITSNIIAGTLGVANAGIRLGGVSSLLLMGNRATGQQYGVRASGDITDTQIVHNDLTGNSVGAFDETDIGATSGYTKADNYT